MKNLSKMCIVSIIVILLVIIGVGGWYLFDSLSKSNNKISELENKLENMNNTITNEVQDSNKNNDTLKDQNIIKDKTITNENIEQRIRDISLKALNIHLSGSTYRTLELLEFRNIELTPSKNSNESNYNYFVRTNVRYEDCKSKMLEYFTEEYFNKEKNEFLLNEQEDGYVGYSSAGDVGAEATKIVSVRKISGNEYQVIYESKVKDDSINEVNTSSVNITVELVNDKYVISNMEFIR